MGPQGSQGAAGTAGPKVDIDILAELCKRGAYVRYAINSMKDIELHDAADAKTVIDVVVVTMRLKAMFRGWLVFHRLKSIVIMYLISIMMHTTWTQIWLTFTIFVCSWNTKLRLMHRSSIGNAII